MRAQLCSEIGGMAIRGGGCPGGIVRGMVGSSGNSRGQKAKEGRGALEDCERGTLGHHLTQVGTVQLFPGVLRRQQSGGAGSSAKDERSIFVVPGPSILLGFGADGWSWGWGFGWGVFRTSVTLPFQGIMGATDCPPSSRKKVCQVQGAVDERSLRS